MSKTVCRNGVLQIMATYEKRGNNSYRIRVSSGRDQNGKQIVRYRTYTPTATTPAAIRKEMEKAARDFEEEVRNGKYLDGEHMTFIDLVERWKENYAVKNISQPTLESYMEILNNEIYPVIGNMKVSGITALHIQSIVNGMSDRGLAPGTVRRAFNVVNGILQKAYKWGIVPENVARRCELPKLTQKDIEFWDAEQASTFLEALNLTYHQKCKGHTRVLASTGEPYTVPEYERTYTIDRVWKEFFSLELHTGMRRGELCGLRWCDVDFDNCTVSVNQVLARVKTGYIVKEPKTESSRRTIAVSSEVIESLKEWKGEQLNLCRQAGAFWTGASEDHYDQNYVFTSPVDPGKPIYPDSVGDKFHKIIKAYNEEYGGHLPNINFHGTRHTSATLLISEGIDVVEVSHRLGHSKTSTTEDIYAHQLQKVDTHAASVLDDILKPKPKSL